MHLDPLEGHPNYETVKDLSRGAYGIVILGRDRNTKDEYALKLMERGQKITRSVEREILNHKKLEHPHVITLYGVFKTDIYLVLILEYASGGNLRKHIASRGRLPEPDARRLFQQLILAADYCHRMGVSSRDIKPDNILLDGDLNLKLADFGYSKDEGAQSLANTKLGTPAYTAPEVFLLKPGESYDAKAADIWSCGVTLFEIVTGVLPFRRPEDSQLKHAVRSDKMIERLLKGEYQFPEDIPLSEGLKDLLSRMLNTGKITLKEITKLKWVMEGLPQGAFRINAMLVQESRQQPPTEEETDAIKSIIREAQQRNATSQGEGASCDLDTIFATK